MRYFLAPWVAGCLLLGALSVPAAAGTASVTSLLPQQSEPPISWSTPFSSLSGPAGNAVSVPQVRPLGGGPTSEEKPPIQAGSSLTLRQAIRIALSYHPRVKEALDEAGAASQRVGEARSYLGPQVYGSAQEFGSTINGIGNTSYYNPFGDYPRMSGRNHDLPAATAFDQTSQVQNNYLMGLSLSQFLFDFGRRHGFVVERQFEARAAEAKSQLTNLDLIFEVSERYFRMLEAAQMVRVYVVAVQQRDFHLHEAQVKAATGLRPELDVYLTQAAVERAQLHLVDARNALADAKVGLDNAMGLSETAPDYQPAEVLTYEPVTDQLPALLRTAMELRPDLKMYEDQARAMGAQITQYRSDYLPTVSAVGGYVGMSTGLPVVNNFNVGILIDWPIFNSFLTTHQVQEARMHQRALAQAIEDLHQRIIMQVHTALLDWQASVQRIIHAKNALEASRAELQLANERYQAGLTNIVELEDAQRYYTQSDAAYASALYSYAIAKAAVDQTTARSLSQFPG